MKHLLIILISIHLLSSPVIGQETGVLYLWENGTKYMGEWKDGKKHGQGTFTSPDGSRYVGEFKDGKKHGQGTFSLSGSKIYEGKWKNGKFNGKGTFIFSNGNKGVGEFRDNKPWNITTNDKDGNYKWKYVKGVRRSM